MNTGAEKEILAYNPMAILDLFNNAITVPETKKLIQVKGIYLHGKGTNYNGYYYDSLRDESSDASLTLIVPSLIRNQLDNNKTIVFYGYITRKVVNTGGRIELRLTITELVEQTHNKYNDAEIQAIEIMQKKVALGYRDVTSFIKSMIVQEEPIRIVVLVGKNAIIDSDIKHQMKGAIAEYDIVFEKINLSSESEILSALERFNSDDTDIVVIARGGGDNLEIFNKPSIAGAAIHLSPYFLTAIGHKEDSTVLQKVADKAFITPSEFGQYLNDIYNDKREELQNSKARLIEGITKELQANYEKQVHNLSDQLKALEELKNKSSFEMKKVHDQQIALLNSQIASLNKNQEKIEALTLQNIKKEGLIASYQNQIQNLQSHKPSTNWVALIIAAILGIVIGLMFRK